MFDAIIDSMAKFKQTWKRSALKRFLVYGNKFHIMIEILYYSLIADENDLFYKPLDHKDW